MIVKICGVTNPDDAMMIAEFGADMIGLNFYPKSPRYIEPAKASVICDYLRDELGDERPLLVGLFVNMPYSHISEVISIANLDFVQLSGDES
ncbi:MAG: N-(5'-phosphoribosyl)anthranilate isomerase, partial [Chloroflexota bacterium]